MPKRKRKPQETPLINQTLLQLRNVPPEIIQAEKVAEKLLNKKLKPGKKQSTKIKSAIRNYQKGVTRYKLAGTLLKKHYKTLLKIYTTYFENEQTEI